MKVDMSENSLDNGYIPRQEWFVNKILAHVQGFTLDCGCGRGLWSRKLRERGHDVISLDFSLRRLKMCKVERNNDNVICASCTHLPFKSDCFDSVLLIEVIEHLDRDSQYMSLHEISRILRIGGIFIMTTPNKYIYSMITKFFFKYNPEHMHELTYGEAKSLVKKYFAIVLVDGKVGGINVGRILDHFVPSLLRWNLLFVGKKVGEHETHHDFRWF